MIFLSPLYPHMQIYWRVSGRILIVTLPEATPVHEAAALIAEVEREHAKKVVVIPWKNEAPAGRERLLALVNGGRA